MKQRSNHPDSLKRAIIKGFADRARALCDEKHLAEKLHNIEDVCVANGHPRVMLRRFREQRLQQKDSQEQEEQESHGVVTVSYLRELPEQFRRIADPHSFCAAFRPGRKVKKLKHTCQEPLGERQKCVVDKISCDYQSAVYIRET